MGPACLPAPWPSPYDTVVPAPTCLRVEPRSAGILVIGLAACGVSRGAGDGRAPTPDFCRIAPVVQEPVVDTILLALSEPIRFDRAPLPAHHGEALIFRQLYATLVREDCAGELAPGLADRWLRGAGGLDWSFELRQGLRFSDGTRIDAAAVRAAWQGTLGVEGLRAAGVASAEALGPRLLRVRLTHPVATPRVFADPALALGGPRGPGGRPGQSGAFRVGGTVDSTGFDLIPERDGVPVIRVRVVPSGADLRDVLDRGIGGVSPPVMTVTYDQATIAYAQRTAVHRAVALPWSRVYVLLSAPGPRVAAPAPLGTREALARDAVLGDARAADASFAIDSSCVSSGPVRAAAEPAIAYPAGDPTARSLAERLLALAAAGAPGQWPGAPGETGPRMIPWTRTVALDSAAFGQNVREAGAAAFVMSFPSRPPSGCRATFSPPAGYGLTPLIETRAYAVLPVNGPTFTIDADGVLRFDPAGWP